MPEWWVTNVDGWWSGLEDWPKTGVVLVLAIVAAWVVRKVVLTRMKRMADATDNDLDDRLVQFFKSFFWVIFFIVVVLIVLKVHDQALTPILAGAGIAGIAIGLAAKETLGDILAGLFLITDRPIRVGDRVKLERPGRHWGGWGDIVDVGIRRTLIRNTDGVIINYPNGVLANSVIINFSHEEGPVRVRVRFQVGYGADLAEVRRVAEAAMEGTDKVIEGTADVVFRALWDDRGGHMLSGTLVEGRYRIADVRHRTRIRSAVLERLHHDLHEAGIPQPAPLIRMAE